MNVAARLENLASLIRQLQGALRGTAKAVATITGGGGSSYTLTSGDGVVSATGTGTGVCRVVLSDSASSGNSIWPLAIVNDNGAFHCTFQIISSSPITIDIHQWDAGGSHANRSFALDVSYKAA